jgi:hypothetical protein
LAAAALYIVSQFKNEGITQHDLSGAADVTEVTIRNRKKELFENLDLEAPKDFLAAKMPRQGYAFSIYAILFQRVHSSS